MSCIATSLVTNFAQILSGASCTNSVYEIDSKCSDNSQTQLMVAAASTAFVAMYLFKSYFWSGWEKSAREKIGDLALRIPYVRKMYEKDVQKEFVNFQTSVQKKWGNFNPIITEIPEKGWSTQQLIELIDKYSDHTLKNLEGKHLSGTVYSKSLCENDESNPPKSVFSVVPIYDKKSDGEIFYSLSRKLQNVFTYAFQKSYLWNSLHLDEFSVGTCIEYQVVKMVAKMFGGSGKEMGFVTSGGTESLMVAMRAYRNWGMQERGHQPGEGVIIASKSVHAGILKAGIAYNVKIVLIDTDENGRFNLKDLEKAVKKHVKKCWQLLDPLLIFL